MINSHKINSAIKIKKKKYQSDTLGLAHIYPKINTPPKSLLILGQRWLQGGRTAGGRCLDENVVTSVLVGEVTSYGCVMADRGCQLSHM